MIPFGCLRLPEHYGERLWSMLAKSKAHKYVRRVPIPGKTTKSGKPRYRYFYHAAHGGGVGAHEHMVEGAAFRDDDGHWHIKKTDGEKLHIEHDESGKTKTVTRTELASMLEAAHAKDLADYRAKAAARVKEARESGASPKQIAALEEHVRRSGGEDPQAKRARVLKQIDEIEKKIDPYGVNTIRPKSWKPLVVSNPAEYARLRGQIHDLQESIGQRPWQRTKEQAKSLGIPEAKHREMVKEAMDAGKNVPPGVLAGHGLAGKEPAEPGAHLTRATADDIPLSLATAAHSGTSHTPDIRAKQERNGYVEHMRDLAAQLAKYETPENSDAIKTALEDYRQGYLKRAKDMLSAKSRVMSSMVTGPARFPVRSNEKKSNTADARREELIDWSEGARKRMIAEFNPEAKRAISSDRPDAVSALQTKLDGLEKQQALMIAANKVYRNASMSEDEKVSKLQALGMSESAARAGLKPDFAGRIGFADYATKNNAAEIRRLKERIGSVAQEQGKATTEHAFDGGRVVDDAESNRIRIYHDTKPSSETIAELKRHGFKWTPSEGAWQRQRSDAARHHAEAITGAKVLSGAPAAPPASKPEQAPADAPARALPVDSRLKRDATIRLTSGKIRPDRMELEFNAWRAMHGPGDSERRGFANGDPYLVHNGEGKPIADFTDEQLRDVIASRSVHKGLLSPLTAAFEELTR